MSKYNILYICNTDWANVTTILSNGINKYSLSYNSNVICVNKHAFNYIPEHQIDLKYKKHSPSTIQNLIKKCDIIIYCQEQQWDLLIKYIPNFNEIFSNKKKSIYHASYIFNNIYENKHYISQIFVPEIYYLGLEKKRKMIIPGCPINTPDNIYEIIQKKISSNTIIISHACSRGGETGIQRKGSNIISEEIKKIQKKYKNVIYNDILYKQRTNSEILKSKLITDIYIDQYNPNIGGFGVSSVESLKYGCIVLSSMNKIHPDFNHYFNKNNDFPIIKINSREEIYKELDKLCSLGKERLVKLMHTNIEWVNKNLTDKYIKYYEDTILQPIFE